MIVSIINQKGGVGKTTTALNVGSALAESNSVLLIDLDPQGSLTFSAGYTALDEGTKTIYEVLKGDASINDAILKQPDGFDLIPADLTLAAGEMEFISLFGRESLLRKALKPLSEAYDYILIDCPPSLNIFTINALAASDYVIIPVQAGILPMKGVSQLRDTIDLVKTQINPKLQILGLLLTFYDDKRSLDRQVMETLNAAFPNQIFNTHISYSAYAAKSPMRGQSVIEYRRNSKTAEQYLALANEIQEATKEKDALNAR